MNRDIYQIDVAKVDGFLLLSLTLRFLWNRSYEDSTAGAQNSIVNRPYAIRCALGWNRQETAAKRDKDSTISISIFVFLLSLVQTVEMSFKRWGPRPNVFAYSFQLEKKRVNWCVNPWGIGTDGIEFVAGLKVQKIRSVYSAGHILV